MIHKRKYKRLVVKLKAGVVIEYRGKVLLIRELNTNTRRYRWNVIKGTFEPGKDISIMETALREAREEANAKVKLRYLLRTYYLKNGGNVVMMFTFVATLLDPKVGVPSKKLQAKYRKGEDIIETRFFTRQELSKLKPYDFVTLRGYLAIQDYLKGKRFPLEILKTLRAK